MDADHTTTNEVCSNCGTPADAGIIFCTKCGKALRFAVPLIPSEGDHGNHALQLSSAKRTTLAIAKGIRVLAIVVFVLCPLRSGTQLLTFVASIATFLICHAVVTSLDVTDGNDRGPSGYWPSKPIDWGVPVDARAGNETSDLRKSSSN